MARSGTRIRDCGGRIMGIGGLISTNPHNPSTTIPNPGCNFINFKIDKNYGGLENYDFIEINSQ
jgi:hypothetical protein